MCDAFPSSSFHLYCFLSVLSKSTTFVINIASVQYNNNFNQVYKFTIPIELNQIPSLLRVDTGYSCRSHHWYLNDSPGRQRILQCTECVLFFSHSYSFQLVLSNVWNPNPLINLSPSYYVPRAGSPYSLGGVVTASQIIVPKEINLLPAIQQSSGCPFRLCQLVKRLWKQLSGKIDWWSITCLWCTSTLGVC